MPTHDDLERLRHRIAPLEMSPEEFRAAGHELVDLIASFLGSLRERPVTPGETPEQVRSVLGTSALPEQATPARTLLNETAGLLFDHSLHIGHPRFFGYITSSAAPIGALADLLAAAVNPNVGAWNLSPAASEIEALAVRWMAEMIGYAPDCGGLFVSGGNTANSVGFLAARRSRLGAGVRAQGVGVTAGRPRVYCSAETHTWVEKAADHYGIGTDGIRWIPTDEQMRMDVAALRAQIRSDEAAGDRPFLVIGTAGSTGVGAVDALPELAQICREHDLWFHVDAAYGGLAAGQPDAPPDLAGLALADSVAIDPHKWLYSPLEAGCALVRNPRDLVDTFSYHPSYYKFDEATRENGINYYAYGPQNSRGFRALKVWLMLRQVGRQGFARMIADDIRLTAHLFRLVQAHPEFQAFTCNLSIATFRYVPVGVEPGSTAAEAYLNRLNEALLGRLQQGGEAFLSNALVGGRYLLRTCIVNFRTSLEDVEALPGIIARQGRAIDAGMRPADLGSEQKAG
ncbi:MAG: aminotransferase class V-fold PLP-dependent enzyme [Chromatiales bacterium]|jgi:glutamate/tyrosine decarboxylase-like PLP-dependent enzyme|nr:aminotransferase class V-fold PLP-dependent enzyme [Chromatiales bacterium]MDX9768413.1 aminotransferase class V-fold PLP-dependent enzyme [Ectothiorhodospiraceae bacterium]